LHPRLESKATQGAVTAAATAAAVGRRSLGIILAINTAAPAAVAWRRSVRKQLVHGRGGSAGDELEIVEAVLD
jgi:hypothetical protein